MFSQLHQASLPASSWASSFASLIWSTASSSWQGGTTLAARMPMFTITTDMKPRTKHQLLELQSTHNYPLLSITIHNYPQLSITIHNSWSTMINSWFSSIYISYISPKINHSWCFGHEFRIKAIAFDILWQVFWWASSLRKRRSFHWPLVIFETSWRATMCHDVKDEAQRLRGICLACQNRALLCVRE